MTGPAALGSAFNRLWMATGAANLADGLALFLLPVMAVRSGASAGGVAAVTMALTSAWPIFGLHAGWLVDRVSRARLLVGVNLVRALTLGALMGLQSRGNLPLASILFAAAVLGTAETLVDTGLTSTVPLVVGPAGLARANSRIEATINGTNQLVGPSLAGMLTTVAVTLTIAASAVLYAVAAATLVSASVWSRVARPSGARIPAAEAPSKGLWDGLRFVVRHPVIRALTLFTAGMNVVWAAVTALLVVYVVEPGPLGLSPAAYGALLTAMAFGGLMASVGTEWLRRRFRIGHLLLLDCVGTVLLPLPIALGAGAWLVAGGVTLAGAGSSIWRILVTTIRQNVTPLDQLGRVYAASRTISWGVLPVSAGAAGLAAEMWGVRVVFVAATVLAGLLAVGFAVFIARTNLDGVLVPTSDEDAGEPVTSRRRRFIPVQQDAELCSNAD